MSLIKTTGFYASNPLRVWINFATYCVPHSTCHWNVWESINHKCVCVCVCVLASARVVCEWSDCGDELNILASLGGHSSCSRDHQPANGKVVWGGSMTGANSWLKKMFQYFFERIRETAKNAGKVISFRLHPAEQEAVNYSYVIHSMQIGVV